MFVLFSRPTTNDISRVEVRHSDALLNGALVGAGGAISAELFLCTRTEPGEHCRDDVGPILRIGCDLALALALPSVSTRSSVADGLSMERGARVGVAPVPCRDVPALQLSVHF